MIQSSETQNYMLSELKKII